jgi:cysteinyl-tRNA synthetase
MTTHPLRVHNTLTGEKENFVPLDERRVTMYVCGPTVYNLVHIGNARPVVVFDTLFRVLRAIYGEQHVVYARNITDVDDKINKAAADNGEPIATLAERFAAEFHRDIAALNTLPPTVEPRATHHIAEMIAMTQALISGGHAYVAEGHVLFDVRSMPDYGRLSKRSLDDMLAGARVEVAPYKQYAGDFVLWKPSKAGEPAWESPWGPGRPGWHLECSAMIEKHLGVSIDIHGGGSDLIFPHHENEIAQGTCAHGGKRYVHYWMHNGFINMDGEKMSKSLGNVRTLRDLLGHFDGEVLRFALLSAHYRSPLNWSEELLNNARAALDGLYGALRNTQHLGGNPSSMRHTTFLDALLDDLNTPQAISELHRLASRANDRAATDTDKRAARRELLGGAALLGLLQRDPEAWFQQGAGNGPDAATIEARIAERIAAKKAKDFARADAIRAELLAQGVVLEDSRDGTRWSRP